MTEHAYEHQQLKLAPDITPESAISAAFQGNQDLSEASRRLIDSYNQFCQTHQGEDERGNFAMQVEERLVKAGVLNELALRDEQILHGDNPLTKGELSLFAQKNEAEGNPYYLQQLFLDHVSDMFAKASSSGIPETPNSISSAEISKRLAQEEAIRHRQREESAHGPLGAAAKTLLESNGRFFDVLDVAQKDGKPDGQIDAGDLNAFKSAADKHANALSKLVMPSERKAVDQLINTFYPGQNWQTLGIFGDGQYITRAELALRMGFDNVGDMQKALGIK